MLADGLALDARRVAVAEHEIIELIGQTSQVHVAKIHSDPHTTESSYREGWSDNRGCRSNQRAIKTNA